MSPTMPGRFGDPARPFITYELPGNRGFSCDDGKFTYTLKFVQQPHRARMCGFGDKDRRPITPPPAIKLVILDSESGKELTGPLQGIPYHYFVCCVDLYDQTGNTDCNLVRHANPTQQPGMAIGSASTTSFPPLPEETRQHQYPSPDQQHVYAHAHHQQQVHHDVYPHLFGQLPMPLQQNGMPAQYIPHQFMPSPQHYMAYTAVSNGIYGGHPSVQPPHHLLTTINTANTAQQYTRNLIGNSVAVAQLLKDDKGVEGIFFVFQDLSVRTEAIFRLKASFVDLGDPQSENGISKSTAKILATVLSDTFTVYSAKKFPGVVESTALSRAFAQQGIKIPIRKDTKNNADQDEYDNDNQDPTSG